MGAKITGGVATGLMVLTVLFSIIALAAPWWTYENGPYKATQSLWKVKMEGPGVSGDAEINDGCKDCRDACDDCLEYCIKFDVTRAFVFLMLITTIVSASLLLGFAICLCGKSGAGCMKCCGVTGIVFTVLAFLCALLAIGVGSSIEVKVGTEDADLNGGGFACLVLGFIFCLISIVLSCVAVFTAPPSQA